MVCSQFVSSFVPTILAPTYLGSWLFLYMAWRCPITHGCKALQLVSALQCSSGGSAAAKQTKGGSSHANPCKRQLQAEATSTAAPRRSKKARVQSKTTSKPLAADDPSNGHITTPNHVRAHDGHKGFCWRCQMEKDPRILQSHASFRGKTWLSMRTIRGRTGLGCRFCASHKDSPLVQRASGGRDPRRFSIFANFQFRPKCLWRAKAHLEQHARSASHRAACEAHCHRNHAAPDAEASDLSPGAAGAGPLHQPLVVMPKPAPVDSDTALLKGNVPSISEWFEGWCVLSEPTVPISGIARSEHKRTNANIGCLRARARK